MALSGTLADIGIVELVQFPSNGRKTGELIIAGTEDEARLYYNEGALVHLTVGDATGIDGLVEVVSWATGEFEFRMGVESEICSIELDLHRALMLALKTRDERAEAERKRSSVPTSTGANILEKANELLERIVSSSDAISGAYLLAEDGEILAQNGNRGTADDESLIEEMKQIASIFESYTRSPLEKLFLDDSNGITHAARVGSNRIVVITSPNDVPMGVVSMTMSKLTAGMVGIV